MPNYEIRLRKQHGGTCAYRANRVSDFAAIRTARSIAADGDAVEVWKDMDCIYSSQGASDLTYASPLAGMFIPARMNA
jgi:hypothetical protein